MSSTRPITSVDDAFWDVLRRAVGLGACALALVIGVMAFVRAGERLTILDAAAGLEDAALETKLDDRRRLLDKAADTLSAVSARRAADYTVLAALARLKLLQAQHSDVDADAYLLEAERRAAEAAARGGATADLTALQAEIAFVRAGVDSQPAAEFLRASYAKRGLDPRLAPTRARLGLALWGALDRVTHDRVKAEACLALRTAPALDDVFKAAAIAAHAPLLPSDYAAWTADAGCQPGE